jgi:hypothetical protein
MKSRQVKVKNNGREAALEARNAVTSFTGFRGLILGKCTRLHGKGRNQNDSAFRCGYDSEYSKESQGQLAVTLSCLIATCFQVAQILSLTLVDNPLAFGNCETSALVALCGWGRLRRHMLNFVEQPIGAMAAPRTSCRAGPSPLTDRAIFDGAD